MCLEAEMHGHHLHDEHDHDIPTSANRPEPPQLYHGMTAHTCGCELCQDIGAGGDGDGDSDGSDVMVRGDFVLYDPIEADNNSDDGNDDYNHGQEGVEDNQFMDEAIRIPGYGCIPRWNINLGLRLNQRCDCRRPMVIRDDLPSGQFTPVPSGLQSPSSMVAEHGESGTASMESSYFGLDLANLGMAEDVATPQAPASQFHHAGPLWLTPDHPRIHGQVHSQVNDHAHTVMAELRYPVNLDFGEAEPMEHFV